MAGPHFAPSLSPHLYALWVAAPAVSVIVRGNNDPDQSATKTREDVDVFGAAQPKPDFIERDRQASILW